MKLDSGLTGGAQTEKFKALQSQAASSGAMQDPAVNRVVTIISQQIIALANGLESGVANIVLNGAPLNEFMGEYAFERMNQESPVSGNIEDKATLSHQDSAVICNAGGANDSGITFTSP